ncbi:RNA polymerase subunit sigma [[Bacillus] enclensis]|uniref:RNA polymerase sigma factor for flagellar operon FliA n=2 Tax=Rossellomorea TaxID=2837508 RepID=A0A0V8HJB5_9BACI|nr:FliA/WhiG family RNA polymerase sigma factor [[Bacillus] enclensis]OAT82817.1 RNA polymerase subunit sigma [Bacillus sp. MKU004]QTC42431.1 FliA/WhiG family RNA polymerase sigma factor [Bacillus sp. V3]QWC24497.1 FliA/WhiG family RNA polymerase sigma factor [Bacillus haikouensis]KSU62538.1 RNA polymerase subunit sigma [[Bacillus] enclensis]MBH9965456.1 FliA/WhiG family RNA polymerase sigma factor [[Bacillus] enclensis]
MSQQPARTEEQHYWDKWISNRDTEAGDLLVKKYMPLVSYHVARISVGLPKNVSREDIKSLGLMGLLDALQKFDPSRDLKFDTYASFRVRGAILDGLRKEDWLPRSTRDKAKRIESKILELEQRHLRHVSAEEVARELEMSAEDVYQTTNEHFFANVLSMDDQLKDEEHETQSYSLKDHKTLSPEEEILKGESLTELELTIGKLSEKEQLVLSLFYKEELTLTEIGEIMKLSTSRISQIHSKAIFKLRNLLDS